MTAPRDHRTPVLGRGPARLTAIAARLTARDLELAGLLHEHKVLTTGQIAMLLFGQPSAARRRMLILHQLGVADRFRPWARTGTASWHYVLGPAGAAVLAAARGTTPAGLGYSRSRVLAVAHSLQLTHLSGVNTFFSVLIATARASGGNARLAAWWSEQRCAQQWHGLARPDAYGRWQDHGTDIDFFLEYDTGTERPAVRVTAKLDAYTRLATATGITTPVLFWFPTPRREQNIRASLPGRCPVPVATASGPLELGESGPAGPVWLPADSDGLRLRLAGLAALWPGQPAGNQDNDADR
jgi:alkylated DNA nucleotide flippase Atl1